MDPVLQAIVDDLKLKAIGHGKQLLSEVLIDALPQVLEVAAKKSATPIDDMVIAALKEPMKQALKDIIAKL